MLEWFKSFFKKKEKKCENCACPPSTEQAKFEIYEDLSGFWRYRMLDHLGRKMGVSGQSFTSSDAAVAEVKYIREHALKAKVVRLIKNPKKPTTK